MIQGASERTIIEQCVKFGRPLPKAIQNAPELALGLEFTYHAFWDLSTCRPTGWSVGYIPWTAAVDYARAHDLDSEEAADFLFLIRCMDKSFVDFQAAKAEENRSKK